jgi:energy-converting hydrogenase Eha subunit A
VLLGWRLFSRVKRMVGRQRLSKVRPWLTLCLFPLLVALLLVGSLSHPHVALALVAGVIAGAGLGLYGLRLTKFERTPVGLFYTPNVHLGIALSALFIARIGYRAAQLYFVPGSLQEGSTAFARSPLTMVIFGTLAGYYIAYAIGLLRWAQRTTPAGPAPASERHGV